jgi:hypothetical protein
MILAYLRDNRSITPWEAIREFGCMRLSARIYDLRRRGVDIRKETERRKNRYGEVVSYARYSIVEGGS